MPDRNSKTLSLSIEADAASHSYQTLFASGQFSHKQSKLSNKTKCKILEWKFNTRVVMQTKGYAAILCAHYYQNKYLRLK